MQLSGRRTQKGSVRSRVRENAGPVTSIPRSHERARATCEHCGTRFAATAESDRFCCSGCEYVYRVIHDESLERFYELRGSVSQPVGANVFEDTDFHWIHALQETAEQAGPAASLTLALEGVSCVGCVWLVDRLFAEAPGGLSCRVNVQYGSLDLQWRSGEFSVADFAGELKRFGYRVCPARQNAESESRQVAWKLGLAGAFALNGMLYTLPGYLGMESSFAFAPHFTWLSAAFSTLSMVFGGSYFIAKAAKAAMQGIAHLDLPISIGIVFAYLASWYGMFTGAESLIYFDFVSTFVFFMLCGRWLQIVAIERNRNRLADLSFAAPEVEIESASGGRIRASAEQLKQGDSYWLRPGQRLPTHSRLEGGEASLGMDWISGETESRLVVKGEDAPSGAALESPYPSTWRSLEDWDQSLLAKLAGRSVRSQERDRVAQKWIFRYLAVAFGVALLGGMAWWLADGLTMGLKVFIAVLVVSCPCALGIAWPFADEIALAKLKSRGVFVTTHSLWNRLSRTRKVAFDKTGTLTRSSLTLLNPQYLDTLTERSRHVLSVLCARSRHPVARSLREAMMAKGLFRDDEGLAATVKERVGLGLELEAFGRQWRLGRANWVALGKEGSRGTTFAADGEDIAVFEFDDRPLPDALDEAQALEDLGLELFILSGDREEKAKAVGRLLGIGPERVFGNMLPEGKARWIEENGHGRCLMVGDGANDTLAFKKALCCGAPANEQGIVAERADFHYLGNGIQGIRSAIEMGERRRRAVRALLAFAISYNLAAGGFALQGAVTPLVAAVLMPLSSIASLAIVWSALRDRS